MALAVRVRVQGPSQWPHSAVCLRGLPSRVQERLGGPGEAEVE